MLTPGPILRLLALPTLGRLGLLLSLVVAVFLAESFTTLMEEALRNDGGSADVFWLLLMEAPEIIDLALAIGVLVAIYFAVQDVRNRGELVILATAGIRWTRVVSFALSIGVFGAILSIWVAGYVAPMARYSERIAMSELRADHVLNQITTAGPTNARQTIRDTTFIATSPRFDDQLRGQLFMFQPNPDGSWRIGQSRDWFVDELEDEDQHQITMKSLQAYEGRFDLDPPRPINVFNVNRAGMTFAMSDVAAAPDYALRNRERLLSIATTEPRRLASVGARALLVPMAALLALAALLAGGSGAGRYVALPIAAILLLFSDVAGRSLIADASLFLSPWVLGGAAIAAYLALPLAYICWCGERIMTPAGRR